MEFDRVAFTIGAAAITVGQLMAGALALLGVILVVLWMRRAARMRLEGVDPDLRTTFTTVAQMLLALIAALGIGLALDIAGILDMPTLLSRAHTALNFELAKVAGSSVTPISVLTFLLVIGVAFQVSRIMQLGISRAVRARGVGDEGTIAIAQRLAHYVVLAIGIAISLNVVGIEISGLFAAGAVFAVGIGFAMQTIAQNFVSGLILLVERTIKPGDILEVEDRTIRVREMGIRSTVARTRDDEDLIIPNATLVQSTVKNLTLLDTSIRVRAPVGVHYESDMHQVLAVLQEASESVAERSPNREPVVLLTGFGSSSVDFEASIWIDDPWLGPQIRSTLLLAIWDALKANDIVIAYPQMDLHLDPPVESALRVLDGEKPSPRGDAATS